MTYRTIKYASMNLDANFYAIIHNGRVVAYEISGAALNVRGYKRVTYTEFIALFEETKKREGTTYQIIEKTTVTENIKSRRVEMTARLDDIAETCRIIAKKGADYSYLTNTERQWNYLPTF